MLVHDIFSLLSQVELDADNRRACREFEDLQVDQLFANEEGRFSSLIDCDKVKSACKNSAASFGTFPQAVGSSRQSATKVSVADIKFDKKLVNGDSRGSSIGAGSGLDNKMKRNETPSSDGYTILDITESLYETIPDDIEPTPASKTSPRGRSSAGSSGGSRKRQGREFCEQQLRERGWWWWEENVTPEPNSISPSPSLHQNGRQEDYAAGQDRREKGQRS